MSSQHKRTYRVLRHWSIRKADWYYGVYRATDWGDTTTVYRVAVGDEDWAKRNAEQLGVEIENDHEIDDAF